MTAGAPARVPPELRELFGLFGRLAESLPTPADAASASWSRRHEVELDRRAVLISRIELLNDHLVSGEKYPDVAEEMLRLFCLRSIKSIGEKLAEPLGYTPVDRPVTDSLPSGDSSSHG